MIAATAAQAAVAVLDFHLPDSAYDKGCALPCGAAPHMQSPRTSPHALRMNWQVPADPPPAASYGYAQRAVIAAHRPTV